MLMLMLEPARLSIAYLAFYFYKPRS